MQNFGTSCIKLAFENKGYDWNRINLFGVRMVKSGDSASNNFDDVIGCTYYDVKTSRWEYLQCESTTVAGLHYFSYHGYTEGTAILKEGFYPNCYALGLYRGIYEALIQVDSMDYYVDGCQNGKFNTTGETKTGIIEANIHVAHNAETFRHVGAYSSASQLISTLNEFRQLVSICKYFALVENKHRFSFALFTHEDIEQAFDSLRQTSPPLTPKHSKKSDTLVGDKK